MPKDNQGFWRTSSVTPGKLAAVAALAITLIVVIVVQSGGNEEPEFEPPQVRRAAQKAAPVNRTRTALQKDDEPQTNKTELQHNAPPKWPDFSRADLAAHDPFRLPATLLRQRGGLGAEEGAAEDQARQAEKASALAELRRQGVSFVVLSDDKHVAMIGDRHVKVGDVVEGFRVVEINADGIVLVEAEQ